MTLNDIKSLPELELIKLFKNPATDPEDRNQIGAFLYQRYESMIHKHWWKLQKQMNNSPAVLAIKDEYYGDAIEAFFNAIEKVDLTKVYDEKFKLMQLASWYIGNVRIKWVKKLKKDSQYIRPLNLLEVQDLTDSLGPDPEAEMAYWNSEGYLNEPSYAYERMDGEMKCRIALEKCFSKWTPQQREIFTWLKEKKTKTEISTLSGYNIAKLNKIIKGLKEDLETELEIPSKAV